MSDDALIEAMARGIYERRHRGMKNVWPWDDSGLDDEHPGVREGIIADATAALAALRKTHAVVPREPSETIRRAGYTAIYGITRHDIVPSLVAERAVEAYRAMLKASEATDA